MTTRAFNIVKLKKNYKNLFYSIVIMAFLHILHFSSNNLVFYFENFDIYLRLQ